MSERTLFLAWQDDLTRQWFPVGRLDADVGKSSYRFRYIGGAKRAKQEVGFPPLLGFPDLHGDYRSQQLFPLFQNRVMNRKRPDFADYLRSLDLPEEADSIEILSANGGRRETDSYEVFPKIEKEADGRFRCRFLLHGWRYVNAAARERINRLRQQEKLITTLDLANPATGLAVQIQTTDYYMIGWSPRYIADDLAAAMAKAPGRYETHVVRANPAPVTAEQRVLIEMQGRLPNHEPMSSRDFRPLRIDVDADGFSYGSSTATSL